MFEVNLPYTGNPSTSPPNCAICLGPCTNKCFSDSCMHQFCFTCLLEWSKVKAVCPLCKQPFSSIIHNVKSNNEYDEHFIEAEDTQQAREVLDENDFLYLPSAPPSRHFQFRTTFTVDPRGELAIQQMLLTHPLTNSVYMPDYNYPSHRRRDTSSVAFRRNVYSQNLWVRAQPDVTGRYRDVSPNFYRENPAARNHLVPWLNRELSALLDGNTQQIMHLVDVILGHLYHHHIRSRFFKNLLREYLGSRTEHFIHEFYSFMRSPYDMIGYDRHIFYPPRSSHIQTISTISEEEGSNSDVTVIGVTQPSDVFRRPTIEVIEINSDSSRDSDVILHEPVPTVVIDLVNSDSDNSTVNLATSNSATEQSNHSDNERTVTTTSKREHSKKKSKDKYVRTRKRLSSKQKISSRYQYSSTSSSSSSDSDSELSDEAKYKYLKRKRKQRLKKSVRSKVSKKYSSSSDDSEPLIETVRRAKDLSRHKRKERKRSAKDYVGNNAIISKNYKSSDFGVKTKSGTPNINVPFSSHSTNNETTTNDAQLESSRSCIDVNNLNKADDYFAGPSNNNNNNKLVSKIKKEKMMWFSRPYAYESDSSVD